LGVKTYRSTLAVLSRYLSQVNAQVALERALRRLDLTPASLTPAHLDALVPHLQRGLGLFVEPRRLPRLLAELAAEAPGGAAPAERIIPIGVEADVSEARLQARQLCQEMGAAAMATQRVATLVSELARNIVLYAHKGRIEVHPRLEPRKQVLVRASDSGPGIANLEQILAGEYKSKTGLGMGIRGSKRLADRFEIESGSWGTRIEAEIHL
jgi:serine/threonine-protein kinase RsbT